MRVIGIYEAADFPKLVVESKKSFASKYGLQGRVLAALRLGRAAGGARVPEDEPPGPRESLSRPVSGQGARGREAGELRAKRSCGTARSSRRSRRTRESPGINYQLADLLLENAAFGEAALEYERTAYDLCRRTSAHPRRATRRSSRTASSSRRRPRSGATELKRATVVSSLKFADTFPEHEHAASFSAPRPQDLYALKDFAAAAAAGRTLIERYPAAEPALRRTAWTVVAHSSAELGDYRGAEPAYAEVLELDARARTQSGRRSSTISRRRSTSRASRPTRRRTTAPRRATSCGSRNARRHRRSGRPRSTTPRPRS